MLPDKFSMTVKRVNLGPEDEDDWWWVARVEEFPFATQARTFAGVLIALGEQALAHEEIAKSRGAEPWGFVEAWKTAPSA